jgi:hypothetical protein
MIETRIVDYEKLEDSQLDVDRLTIPICYHKEMKQIILLPIAIILTLLGLLWFIQGIGLLNITPILCFANCQPITGGSPVWAAIGALMLVVGVIIIGNFLQKKRR